MPVIRVKRKIQSSLIRIRELEKLKGKDVLITIENDDKISKDNNETIVNVAGALNKYGDKELQNLEKSAWGIAVKDKYEDR